MRTQPLTVKLGDQATELARRNLDQRLKEHSAELDTLSAAAGRLLAVQQLTGTGTYTPTPGTRTIHAWVQGGGGGGGGAGTGANFSAAAGGGSGVALELLVTAATAITGGAFACGAGGTGGANTPTGGGTGGDTTFTANGAIYTAKGGTGGAGMANTAGPADAAPGAGGAGSTSGPAVLRSVAWRGERGSVAGSGQFPGDGASSFFGLGGLYAVGGAPTAGAGFGSGGGGGANGNNVGAAGAPGCVLVEEYS